MNYIYKFVKNNKKQPVGVVVAKASDTSAPAVFVGWSRCKVTGGDTFNKERGLKIALGRAEHGGGEDKVPHSMTDEITAMGQRATKYFKDKKVYAVIN